MSSMLKIISNEVLLSNRAVWCETVKESGKTIGPHENFGFSFIMRWYQSTYYHRTLFCIIDYYIINCFLCKHSLLRQ